MTKPRALLVALAASAALAVVGIAAAHTGVEDRSPKAGATLAKAPNRVTVTFAEEIRNGSIAVRNPAGKVISKGPGGKDPANVRRLSVALKRRLRPGRYTVRFAVTAPDGDTQNGSFSFRVR